MNSPLFTEVYANAVQTDRERELVKQQWILLATADQRRQTGQSVQRQLGAVVALWRNWAQRRSRACSFFMKKPKNRLILSDGHDNPAVDF